MRYFHGGYPGLRAGETLQPPDTTGTDRTLSQWVSHEAPHAKRRDVVYVASVRDVARAYAAFYPDGALYEVRPLGDIEPDPDCETPGLSWQCPAATVLSVVDPVVLFRTCTPERWLRMLTRNRL